jgi:2-isopropylmalate synthase
MQVRLYDTTLRDGTQREGLSLSVPDKLKVAQKLAELGIHYIEGGFPGSNPKDIEFFKEGKGLDLGDTRLVAFGSTRRKDTAPEQDKNLVDLVSAGTPAVCIFGKSWDVHVTSVLVTTLEENLEMIYDSVLFLKKNGLEVIYDAEHFFDGFKNNRTYALSTLAQAERAGADWIVLCDTNGGSLPTEIQSILREVRSVTKVPLGIHAHNDAECAVANSLMAVQEGATQVQGTINGYGERCGNANLVSIIPDLMLKMGIECLSRDKLGLLMETAHHVSEIANLVPDPHQPYVGQSAFAHKGGIHVSAVLRQKGAYEHIDPVLVGNMQRVLVSELSGAKSIVEKAREVGIDLTDRPDQVAAILGKLKDHEHQGYHYEVADGSFALFVMKHTGAYRPLFDLESYEVGMDHRRSGRFETEAVVKLRVKDQRLVEIAEGNGPVNALDRCLRKALEPAYPELSKIKLTDYKVRVFDVKKGTAAVVRVLIETTDGERTWGSIGVSENIIEASWEALVDSIEYGLLKQGI